MQEVTEMFEVDPSLQELVDGARRNFRCRSTDEMTLRGRADCGRGRAHYALIDLANELQWDQYKILVEKTSVACLEVVVDVSPRAPQGGTQESIVSRQKERLDMADRRMSDAEFLANIANDSQFSVAMARDDFPDDTFEREVAQVDVDYLSESSAGEEYGGAPESEESESEARQHCSQ
ncbi:hypothetical protein HU200_029330 [Digitaria exilis]|uniref:Uncharacterized protein n=1 Tax=Digitaria exilis TaxID=1010633 RepID=A0A835BTD9_9POAL|nr:hypothetical protein HU200_029330 [Digitaria exilis]